MAATDKIHEIVRIQHKDAVLRTSILFMQAAKAVLKYSDAQLYRDTGLSGIKFSVLQGLVHWEGGMTLSDIARWTQTERHNITTLVKRMTKEGLIKVTQSTTDKRVFLVTITDKGRAVLDKAMPTARSIIDKMMNSISPSEAGELEGYLDKIRSNAHEGLKQLSMKDCPGARLAAEEIDINTN